MKTQRDIKLLNPAFREKVELFMIEAERLGVFITETLRSDERQAHLRVMGLSKIFRSKHQDGLAFDIAFNGDKLYLPSDDPTWRIVAEIAKRCEIDWGYDLWGWDMVHFQDNGKPLSIIPSWGSEAWDWAVKEGLITRNSRFSDNLTKGELIVILNRFNSKS